MKTNISLALLILTVAFVGGCDSKPAKREAEKKVYIDILQDTISGFNSIEDLSQSFVQMLEKNDYEDYLRHTMQKPMEEDQASRIRDDKGRQRFLEEYGFTLKEEQHYFDYTVNFLKTHEIDPETIKIDEMVSLRYKEDLYKPLELYEVYIPLDADHRENIYYVAIKVDGQYYLTSELSAL